MIEIDDTQPEVLKAPFPWFGGKSRASHLVWDRFGNVPNYVEPFAGSLAVLLGRDSQPRVETVNDIDCWIANFWRALQADYEGVATYANWPVNEADLHARHLWLVNQVDFRERMKTDPEYFDPKIAGWWVWGVCQWIGSGWCAQPDWRNRTTRKMPYAGRDERGALSRTAAKRQNLSCGNGNGIGVTVKRPRLGRGQGRGVSRQLPQLGGDAGASGGGVHSLKGANGGLQDWLATFALRLRRVRVCCGDWARVVGPAVTFKIGLTGVFLDPPYDMRIVSSKPDRKQGRLTTSDKLYEHHDNETSSAVRKWAIENGANPLLRIALCGYEGEHEMPSTWTKIAWKANGGFGNQNRNTSGAINATRERIWFSPHCLGGTQQRLEF